ncbi:hypothetical protein Tco_1054351 [Tanacetum coccineum]|uniref:Uncharacterized protein n=1 Tax=Tanacetum coccineum TaxID=301880 RepID=A0ABQ5GXI1_9ASTR
MFTTINVISRHEDTQLYGAILPKELTNEDIRNSESYKEYYAIASGKVPPKTKASVHKKKADSDTTHKRSPPTKTPNTKIQTNWFLMSKYMRRQTFSDGDDDDEDDDTNEDSDEHDDDDDVTELDDDSDNITHPKLSTFLTDDQKENNDEEEQEDDDDNEEEISDQFVRTPSDYQISDESEKQKDDDKVKDGEEDKEGDVMNVNLEGGDVDMTDADTTKDTEDAMRLSTAATPVDPPLSSYGDVIIIPRPRDDKDKDEEPFAGSNRGTKRRRSGKESESSKELTHKESWTISDDDVIPSREVHDERQWHPLTSPTPDREWHLTKIVSDLPPQHWITDLVQAAGTQSSFDEFMATPINFSTFMINRLKIDHLTQELLTGPTYNLMKGTCKSVAELDYHLEEVFKATNEQLDWIILKECHIPIISASHNS